MILSVSRRTDIPAFYSEWFFNRLREGFVDVRNPMNIHQVSRIKITPDVVDCIVFWTKNPSAMLPRLSELEQYKYYFQFTVNSYDKTIETYVDKKTNIIETFKSLSQKIGSSNVIWRYDPILLSDDISMEYHIKYFEEIAKRLCGFTKLSVISFVDLYKKTVTNTKSIGIRELDEKQMQYIAKEFVCIAGKYGMKVQSCAEKIDLEAEGVAHAHCIDPFLIQSLCGYQIDVEKDKNQRAECGCVQSIDIGAYNTCKHQCAYCYANFNATKMNEQSRRHDPQSSLLIGHLNDRDVIKERSVKLLKSNNLFS